MKFLTFADLHGDFGLLKKLIQRAKEKDIEFVLLAGDFTAFERSMRAILKKLDSIGKPVFIIPGNHEEGGEYKKAIKDYPNCKDVHKKAIEVDDFVILSFGGGGFSATDSEFREIGRKWYGKYKDKKIILMTHGPPYNTTLDDIDGKHVGNKDYRKFIERIKPKLAISGHLHETFGAMDKIGKCQVINPGWEGMVVEL